MSISLWAKLSELMLRQEIWGLSTDEKPIGLPYDSLFKEMDTQEEYIYTPSGWILFIKGAANKVWDTGSLSWVAMTQPLIKTDSLTVTGSTTVTNFPETQEISGSVQTESTQLTLRLDDTSEENIMYVGEATTGSAENASVWRIKKIDMIAGVITKWAGGAATFVNKWTERLTPIVYS